MEAKENKFAEQKIICQCNDCNEVFEYKDKIYLRPNDISAIRCPNCKGTFKIIQHRLKEDDEYLDELSLRWSE